MAPKIDQKEYLKRYLSNDKDKKKKKKKKDKKATKPGNVVIVDDDLDLVELQKRIDADETDLFGLDEEAPLVVGIIDERPPELRAKEDFSSTKWKAVANSFDGMLRGSNRADSPPGNGVNRRRKDSDESPPRRISKEKESLWGKAKKQDSDESPPRKGASRRTDRRGKDSDESPSRKTSKERDSSRGKAKRDDSDESPPRKSGSHRTDRHESPSRRKSKKDKRRDSDESPPRKNSSHRTDRRGKDSDESPPRRRSKDKESYRAKVRRDDSDESPRRKGRSKEGERYGRREDSDESPPRKRKQREDSDPSPPRKHRVNDSDESPPRRKNDDKSSERKRNRRDLDESPPRHRNREKEASGRRDRSNRERDEPSTSKAQYRSNDYSGSPSRAKEYDKKKTSNRRRNSDESPPHRSRPDVDTRRRKDSDESPPRRREADTHESSSRRPSRAPSPPIRIKQEKRNSDSDLSPPRRRDSDESPPRRKATTSQRHYRDLEHRIKQEPRSPSQRRNEPPERMSKTLDGKRAGLQDAASLREENEKHRARERDALMKMSDDVSGRYADTVVRDKSGRRRDVEKELREELAKRKHDEKKKEVYSRWGKGVKQAEDYKAQLQEAAHEMEKPLARYADDKDLDEYLKQQERDGDPMLEYLRSKQKEENKRAGIPEKPVYQGAFPDNRFGIRPGYRWDGVDRSNGFEKSWFETTSKKKAGEEEAYKYSVEDM